MRDITELKRVDQNLREQNIALTHSLPGIARLDSNGNYTHVNDVYAGLLGYTPKELVGQSWKITVAPKDITKGEQGYQQMLKEENVEFDIEGIKKDGSPIFKHVLISKRTDDNGELVGHLCLMKDISQQVKAEKNHKELQNQLNHVMRLSNMNEMATGLAHEISQPLTAISNYCDAALTLLKSEPTTNPMLLEVLQGVSEQAHRAGKIVRNCRQFASKQPMEKLEVDLNDLTQETMRFLDSDTYDNEIDIQLSLYKNLPAVKADKVQIQQVLINLIRNGVEAMQNNNVKARNLSIYTQLNNGNGTPPEAQVTIKETGPGLEISQVKNLFQPFYTTKTSGMGMGLTISRSIINAHGGKLWLDQRENKNTKFHFTLPINSSQQICR